MAKKHELATLSKANKDLALLIDEDLQKESELLQKLIKEVYEANQKVKEGHIRRVQETNQKLNHLNREIDALKKDIDTQDKEITTEQFNYLLKSKDQIFDALNTMRLFDNEYLIKHPIHTHLSMLKERIKSLITANVKESSARFDETFLGPLTDRTLSWVERLFKDTETTFETFYTNHSNYQKATETFQDHNTRFKNSLASFENTLLEVFNERTHFYYTSTEDDFLSEKIERLYERAVGKIETRIETLKTTFEQKIQAIDDELETLEKDTLEKFKQKYAKRLESEIKLKESLQDDLKKLRFDIMKAEKTQDIKRLNQLLATYDKKEKQNLSLYQEKVKQLAKNKTKRQRDKLLKARKALELKFEDDTYKAKLQLESEKLKFKESSALFKVREDQKALENDQKVNSQLIAKIKHFETEFMQFKKAILHFSQAMHKLATVQTSTFLKDSIEELKSIEALQKSFQTLQLKLTKQLADKSHNEKIFGAHLKQALLETKENIAHQQKLQAVLKNQNTQLKRKEIDSIRAQEDAKNELIFQNTRIEIAEKEFELQLIKIQSLYENEVDLTKSQAERLNIGMGVNETMVRTTVESQILFAKQQIKFAQKEYEARLENIERARAQELEYAQQKLTKLEQPYLYERKQMLEARDSKLETLEYRLALFVEDKDRLRLEEQRDKLKDYYEQALKDLAQKQTEDPQIIRYKNQIEAAEKRAEKGRADAKALKEKTIVTFEELLQQSEEKLELFTNREDTKLVPYIESASATTAKTRLDEAVEEAKAQRDEKIEAPKKRIEELETMLKDLTVAPEAVSTETTEAIDAVAKQHLEVMEALNNELDSTIQAIQSEKAETDKTFDEAISQVESNSIVKHQSELKANLLRQVKKQEAALDQNVQKALISLEQSHKQKLKDLDQEALLLNKNLNQTIRAFKRYIKSKTTKETPKLKPIRKSLEEQRKTNKTAIEDRY